MGNILLTGTDDLLAANLSSLELGHNSSSSIYRLQPANETRAAAFLQCAAQRFGRIKPENQEINSRLHVVDTGSCPSQVEKVWHFDFPHNPDSFMQFLTTLPRLGVRELNLVIPRLDDDSGICEAVAE